MTSSALQEKSNYTSVIIKLMKIVKLQWKNSGRKINLKKLLYQCFTLAKFKRNYLE